MKLGKTFDKVGEAALGIASVGFASLAFMLVFGRFIDSTFMLRLEQSIPFLGLVTRPMRRATHQVYDAAE